MSLRRWFVAALAAAGLGAFAPMLLAADFPVKPVTLISPTVPGGAMDGVARLIAQRLGPRLGQPVVIDSKPGAGGTLGVTLATKAPADGHTLVIVADSYLTVAPRLLRGVSLQPFKDLAPVIELGSSPMVLVAHPSLRVKTLADYLAKVRAEPGKVTYASAGAGSPHHLFMATLEQQLGLRLAHVPYKGGPQAFSDVLGGHADSMFIVMSTAEPHIKSGKLVALGVSGAKRLPEHPNIPPIAEQAAGYESEFWFAIFAPSGTPAPVTARLHREIAAVLAEPEVIQGMKALGVTPTTGSTPDALAQKLRREDAKMERLIRETGLKPE